MIETARFTAGAFCTDRMADRGVTAGGVVAGYGVGSIGNGGFAVLPGSVLAYYLTHTLGVGATSDQGRQDPRRFDREGPVVQRVFDIDIGTPIAPVLVNTAPDDDSIPYGQARQLVDVLPAVPGGLGVDHLAPAATDFGVGLGWISDRFAGIPPSPSCL